MTASTVSGEKKMSKVELVNDGVLSPLRERNAGRRAAGDSSKDLIHSTVSPRRTRKLTSSNPEEDLSWQTILCETIRNILRLLVTLVLCLISMRYCFSHGSDNLMARTSEVRYYFRMTTTMLQFQLKALDAKMEVEVLILRGEMNKKLEENNADLANRVKTLDENQEFINKALDQLSSKDLLSKEDFARFYEESSKSKVGNSGHNDLSLDEIRALARQIVEKEIGKHAADGLGRVDYALATGGALVAQHSEPFIVTKGRNLFNHQGVHNDAKRMLKPSFGEPGQCFPLKGNSGFVEIRLRTAIIPEAVTLEYVDKSVAYDRSSAPRDCRVYGWLQGEHNHDTDNDKTFLTEFTYDLEKSNAQTYNVFDSATFAVVDTIRLDFTSNHGSPSHTCICRLRVHGHEPNALSHFGAVLH